MNADIAERLRRLAGETNVCLNEPMSRHTTFRVGGPADIFVKVHTSVLPEVVKLCENERVPYVVIGNGSNLLVGDGGVRGVVLKLTAEPGDLKIEENHIIADAGVLLSQVAAFAAAHGLTGLEFAAGIPGTVGGAVVMNAGAYGGEMKNVIESVRVLHPGGNAQECIWAQGIPVSAAECRGAAFGSLPSKESQGMPVSAAECRGAASGTLPSWSLSAAELDLGYRHSCILEKGYLVTEVTLALRPGNREGILIQMEELKRRRIEKQPLNYPSAGSTFKRPEGHFAGKLIMDAGLKGYRVGGAMVSPKHCGFVINYENATAKDICLLMEEIRERVWHHFDVKLEPEVKKLGEFL